MVVLAVRELPNHTHRAAWNDMFDRVGHSAWKGNVKFPVGSWVQDANDRVAWRGMLKGLQVALRPTRVQPVRACKFKGPMLG